MRWSADRSSPVLIVRCAGGDSAGLRVRLTALLRLGRDDSSNRAHSPREVSQSSFAGKGHETPTDPEERRALAKLLRAHRAVLDDAGTLPLSDRDDPLFRLDAGQEARAFWGYEPEDALIGLQGPQMAGVSVKVEGLKRGGS